MRCTLLCLVLGLFAASAGGGETLRPFDDAPDALRKEALALARQCFETYRNHGPAAARVPDSATLSAAWNNLPRTGLFVTLVHERRVRGCMGALHPTARTWRDEIIRQAMGALSQDTRYPIVDPGEDADFTVILSFVGAARPLARLGALDPWSEGLLVEQDGRAGVLLPGEAKTARWEFAETCRKGGIDPEKPHTLTRFETCTWIAPPRARSATPERTSP